MREGEEFYKAVIVLLPLILCRINLAKHRKNYKEFSNELNKLDSKYNKELNMLMKHTNKHYEIQEQSQLTYVLVTIIAVYVLLRYI